MSKGEDTDKGNDRYNMFGFGYFSKPFWVRYFGVQTNTINERLLAYNVRSIFVSIPIILFVLFFI